MKVFLSYAKEDKDFILECYDELKRKNFDPWMDEHDLLPGQAWDECLKTNMKDTDVVLIFMSSDSVSKIGYVQREWKYFIDKRKEFPENFIYLIPVQLDRCTVPQFISSEIQFINIHRDLTGKEWSKVLRSLELAAEQRNINQINKDITKPKVELREISEKFESLNGYEFNGSYPFIKSANDSFKEANELIYVEVLKELSLLRSRYFDKPLDIERQDNLPTYQDIFDLSLSGNIGYIRSNFISLVFTHYAYTGGAHGNHYFSCHHYFIKDGKAISINPLQIFSENLYNAAEEYIKDYCTNDLIAQISHREEDDDIDQAWIKNGCQSIDSEHILIKENSLEIYFAPYSVTGYASGDFIVDIPFYRLTKFFNKEKDSLFMLIQESEN